MSTEVIETECDLGPCRVHFTVGNEFGPFGAEFYMVEIVDEDSGDWEQVKNDDEWRDLLDTEDNRNHAIDRHYN